MHTGRGDAILACVECFLCSMGWASPRPRPTLASSLTLRNIISVYWHYIYLLIKVNYNRLFTSKLSISKLSWNVKWLLTVNIKTVLNQDSHSTKNQQIYNSILFKDKILHFCLSQVVNILFLYQIIIYYTTHLVYVWGEEEKLTLLFLLWYYKQCLNVYKCKEKLTEIRTENFNLHIFNNKLELLPSIAHIIFSYNTIFSSSIGLFEMAFS